MLRSYTAGDGSNTSPVDGCIMSKMYVHTMEYYSASKSNEMLIHGATWVNLGEVLSGMSQSLDDLYDSTCEVPRV